MVRLRTRCRAAGQIASVLARFARSRHTGLSANLDLAFFQQDKKCFYA